MSVNTAPTLDTSKTPALPDSVRTTGLPAGAVGVLASTLVNADNAADVDGDALGVAIIGVRSGMTLHYSLDDGVTWRVLTGTVSQDSALVLAADARVYLQLTSATVGTTTNALTIKAWDMNGGAASGDTGVGTRSAVLPQTTVALPGVSAQSTDVAIQGQYAYVTIDQAGLAIVDLGNPAAPVVTGSLDTAGRAQSLSVSGNYAYVADGIGGVSIIDVSAPATPSLVSTFKAGTQAARALVKDGDYLYVVGDSLALAIYNVANPAAPVALGTLGSGQHGYGIVVRGDYAYVATANVGLKVYNISNPAAPVLATTVAGSTMFGVTAKGDYLYVAAASDGVTILDISNPALPVQVATYDTTGSAYDIDFDGNYAYVASSRTGGVQVLNMTDPLHPSFVTSYVPGTFTEKLTISDGKLYATTLSTAVLQITKPVITDAFSSASDTVSVTVTAGAPAPIPDPAPAPAPVPTPAPTPVVPTTPGIPVVTTSPAGTIDGVAVQGGTAADGTHVLVIPVVPGTRSDDASSLHNTLADIPIFTGADGKTVLSVSVPTGGALSTAGLPKVVTGTDATGAFTARIQGSSADASLLDGATTYFSGLPAGQGMVVNTVTPTAENSGGMPMIVYGTPDTTGPRTFVVFDSSALPGSTRVELHNVDFAAIIGAARVTGGTGNNVVYGDGASQFIVLGAGDDILHGGGGNDTVGSLRGNDQTFGDAGDDVVYGGTGNDTLSGGAGNDALNGGLGLDTALQSGALADYTVTRDGNAVVLTHKTTGEIDRLLDVEVVRFESGSGLVIAHEAGDVATLKALQPDAQVIELNLDRAVTGTAGNDAVTPDFGIALNIDLGAGQDTVRIAGARADVNLSVEAGQRVELTRLADGAMLGLKNVDVLAFGSGEVTALAQNAGEAVLGRAYELLLNRNVDAEGYGFWLAAARGGASVRSLLDQVMQSTEFVSARATLSNGGFVDLIYQNGLERAADAVGRAFWVSALDAGVSRAQVVESIAASSEAITVIGSTIDVTVVS